MSVEYPETFLRLFLALFIPAGVRLAIACSQSQLRRFSPPGAFRWTQPDQFHVTLKFLGDVPLVQVGPLEKAVSMVCAGFAPLQVVARGIGFFPQQHTPRVIWAGAQDTGDHLTELRRQLESAMRPFAPAESPENFTGHITLGRFKPGYRGSIEKLIERTQIIQSRHFGDWIAPEVNIVRSQLTPQGAVHTTIGVGRLRKEGGHAG